MNDPATPQLVASGPNVESSGRRTVVLVDDTTEVRMLVRTRLRIAGGFTVVAEGGTGREAVALAAEHRPALMVLDISMPDVDGFDALPQVLAVSPGTRVVIFTGFDDAALADRALAAGAADVVPKSFPVDRLAERLRAALDDAAGAAAEPTDDGAPPVVEAAGADPDTAVLDRQGNRFQVIFEQAEIGMATLSLTGRLMHLNPALAGMVGRPESEVAGHSFTDLVDAEDRPAVEHALTPVAQGVAASRGAEHRLAGRSVRRWVATTFTVVRDRPGRPLYLFAQVQDVTEQRAARRALRSSEERFRLLVETVRDYGIFMLDETGHIASWNAGAQRLKGYTAADIIGQHFRVFYTPEAQRSRHPEHELKVAAATGRYEDEGWRVRKDGSLFWANVIITALRDDAGDLVGFAKVTRDVTERERLAAARAQATQAANLLAVIAHELRSPVGVVTGTASTLATHWPALDDGERSDLLASLVSTSQRIRRLVEDLLMASRLEAGALDIRPERCMVRPVLEAALLEALRGDDGTGTSPDDVVVSCEPSDLEVLADADRLQQMVVNYLTNALRYGRAPLHVVASARPDGVRVEVSDHGDGLAPDLERALFQRFAVGRDRRGTGLGLYIVRELARAQGGDAAYERSAGTTTFSVLLPAAAAEPARW